jgi:hypothetical protein
MADEPRIRWRRRWLSRPGASTPPRARRRRVGAERPTCSPHSAGSPTNPPIWSVPTGVRQAPPAHGRATMAERVDKPELMHRVARRLDRDAETVAEIVDGFLEEVYAATACPCAALAPSTSGRSGTAGCSSLTRHSACARCLVGRRPTAGRCELHGSWDHRANQGVDGELMRCLDTR